jgi:prepilin-type N-terminal cleavage/methylation domain-containing protein
MKINTTGKSGFTLVEIMIVVAIIGLLAAIAVPNFVRARESAQLKSIINNLRLIEGAKDQWALENKRSTGSTVTSASLKAYLRNNAWVTQLAGETYNINVIGTLADASFATLVGKTSAKADGTTQ